MALKTEKATTRQGDGASKIDLAGELTNFDTNKCPHLQQVPRRLAAYVIDRHLQVLEVRYA
jgi:hypothetical protein